MCQDFRLSAKLLLRAALWFMVAVLSMPVSAQDNTLNSQLSQLENRLFLHDYSSDPADERLVRLEQMVFGEQRKGSPPERVKRLTTAVTGTEVAVPQSVTSKGTPTAATIPTSPKPATTRQFVPAVPATSTAASNVTTAPPAASVSSIGFRPPTTAHLAPAPTNANPYQSVSTLPPAAPSATRYVSGPQSASSSTAYGAQSTPPYFNNIAGKVDSLETAVFGSTYTDPLPIRVLRLESRVFPQMPPATNLSLTERVTRLLGAVNISSSSSAPVPTSAPSPSASPRSFPVYTY